MHSEDTEPPGRPPETTNRRWQMILSYVVAGACLTWVLYNVHPRHFLRDVRHTKPYRPALVSTIMICSISGSSVWMLNCSRRRI